MSGPRIRRIKRPARLASAKVWLLTYTGRHVARSYMRRYGVDWETAFIELPLLGVSLDSAYIASVRSCVNAQRLERQRRRALVAESRARSDALWDGSDANFAFIAGYTTAGVPYGVLWR